MPTRPNNSDERQDRLAELLATTNSKMDMWVHTMERLDEIVNGTAKTGGLKERMGIVEKEQSDAKTAWKELNQNLKDLRAEMLVEVGKINTSVNTIKGASGSFWRDLGVTAAKAATGVVVVGVTGTLFYKLIQLLAVYIKP